MFITEAAASVKDKTVHEELANQLNSLMRPAKTDPMVVETILNHLWFFVDIIVKSMAQHLLSTGRIKVIGHVSCVSKQGPVARIMLRLEIDLYL